MLKKTRLLSCALVAVTGSLCTVLAANADTLGWQANAQYNQIQQAARQGLITPAQANDLLSRASSLVAKDQQWSMQDGGSLNTPDRLSLQNSLNRLSKRFQNSIQNNGYNTGGILNGLLASNNLVPYGGNAYGAAYGNAYANANGYGGGCHHHRHNGMRMGSGNGFMNNAFNTINPLNAAYTAPYVSPVNYTSPYNTPYANAYGNYNQGLLGGLLNSLANGGISRF